MDSNSSDRELNKIFNDEPVEFGWWLEISTAQPTAIYYFGSFDSQLEAELAKAGYIEDLKQEEAEVVTVRIKQCRPRQLTICEDELSFGRTHRWLIFKFTGSINGAKNSLYKAFSHLREGRGKIYDN